MNPNSWITSSASASRRAAGSLPLISQKMDLGIKADLLSCRDFGLTLNASPWGTEEKQRNQAEGWAQATVSELRVQRSPTESQSMTKYGDNIGAAPPRKAVRVPQGSVLWAPQSEAKLCSTHSTKHGSVQQVACSRLHAVQSMLLPIAHAPQVTQPSNNSSLTSRCATQI